MVMRTHLGIDVGGTNIKAVLWRNREVLATAKRATGAGDGVENVVERVLEVGDELAGSGGGVGSWGCGFPALLDRDHGTVLESVILPGFEGYPLRDRLLAKALARGSPLADVPLLIENDATAAGWGEYECLGQPRDETLLVLTLGTGIGGCAIAKGRVLRGARGQAGEFGNLTVEREGAIGFSPNRGALNDLCSGRALVRRYQQHNGGAAALVDPMEVAERAWAGDALARDIVEDAARALGAGVANLIHAFDPHRVCLAGGLARLGEGWLQLVREEVRKRSFPSVLEAVRIEWARGGEFVGALGAAALASRLARQTPEVRVPSKSYFLQYRPCVDQILDAWREVLLEDKPILGAAVTRFEEEFARYLGVPHAVGTNSGTDALVIAFRSLGLGPGDEVITSAHTYVATVSAIAAVGATPVLVDPDEQTMNLTAAAVAAAITPRTRGIVPVHMYGRLCPMADVVALAREWGLVLVEDAAQAHGARDEAGRAAGSFGDAGCFSFHPSKNLGAFGDGGLVCFHRAELAERARMCRNFGKRDKHTVEFPGLNSKLDTLQARLLLIKLPGLDAVNERRRHLASLYANHLEGVGDLVLPPPARGLSHVHHLYVVRTARRDALRRHLAVRGVQTGLHYPIPPHRQPWELAAGLGPERFPIADRLARTVLSLPIASELRDAQIEEVCDGIREFFHDG
jgi:dTDP-4-amino-4,6-dideoxygalactose transaminase/predicted NBD/HSP70 family sugar kinase